MDPFLFFYDYVRCGLWASSGPFPLSAHYGLHKRGRDPPTNPSRHLKKKECSSLKWLLKEDQGRRPTAAATAAAPPRAAAVPAAETAASPCLGRYKSSCRLPAAAATGSQHRRPFRSSPSRAQLPPFSPSTDLHPSSLPPFYRQPLPRFPLLSTTLKSPSLHHFFFWISILPPFPFFLFFPNFPFSGFLEFSPQSQDQSSSEFPIPCISSITDLRRKPFPSPTAALSTPSSPCPILPTKSRTNHPALRPRSP